MKHRLLITVLFAVASFGCTTIKPIPADPKIATQEFYQLLHKHQVSGLPEGAAWRGLKPRCSDELTAAIIAAQKQQAVCIRMSPNEKPPWIEGDLFSSLFEGAQTFRVGAARITGDRAEVTVHLMHKEGNDTATWTDTFILKHTTKGWLVDDIRYDGKWPYAPSGTLMEVLTSEGC